MHASLQLTLSLLTAIILLIPLMIKWDLDRTLALPAIISIGALSGVLTSLLNVSWPLTLYMDVLFILSTSASLLLWRFFRDPERHCDPMERIIRSAADGHVIYIKKIEAGQVPVSIKKGREFSLNEFSGTTPICTNGYLIGTSMSYLDVHINRAPITGEIRFLKHIHGRFMSLRNPEATFENERVSTVIEGSEISLGVIQIASRMVRNIIPFVGPGDDVEQGQRVGKIRFGSQVDLIVPDLPDLEILVKSGDKLTAGITTIARY